MLDRLPTRTIQRYGWRPDTPDHRDRIYNNEEIILSDGALPLKFSLRDQLPGIYDQGQLGSCTANAIAGCLEGEAKKQGEAAVTPSRLFIYYNERVMEGTVNEDAGAEIRDGIKSVNVLGAPPETDWAYDIRRFAEKPPASAYGDALKHQSIDYKRVLPGTPGSPIRTPLFVKKAPVCFGFVVPYKFEDGSWNPESQALPVPSPSEEIIGGHAVDIIGWDFELVRFKVPAFEVRNSWSDGWGDAGHFWMDARWMWNRAAGLTSDFWTILTVE